MQFYETILTVVSDFSYDLRFFGKLILRTALIERKSSCRNMRLFSDFAFPLLGQEDLGQMLKLRSSTTLNFYAIEKFHITQKLIKLFLKNSFPGSYLFVNIGQIGLILIN